MSKAVISVENLSKCYKLGISRDPYPSIREAIMGAIKSPLTNLRALSEKGTEKEMFWALKDVGFEVNRGEVIGVIGSNGAGKSTLLKILSRITEPTSGRVVLRGRVASLLEVGTGFHPELTGRENVYLNGSILGMAKSEIDRKFDEIVAFAEISRFLDTPVKRYSSGMYVRLAFAVAAHLEPEILIVDEVLAVGDAEFQKKCLGKMQEVASGHGRTVLFVSHNMSAVQRLCPRSIFLRKGELIADGPSPEVVRKYLTVLSDGAATSLTEHNPERGGSGALRLTSVRMLNDAGQAMQKVVAGEPMNIEVRYKNPGNINRANIHFYFYNHLGTAVTDLETRLCYFMLKDLGETGTIRCRVPRSPFPIGRYRVGFMIEADERQVDSAPNLLAFDVEATVFFPEPRTPELSNCAIMVEHQWSLQVDGQPLIQGDPAGGVENRNRQNGDGENGIGLGVNGKVLV
jgi:lipopolysaccharide transport system ATP-binding protein